MNAISKDRISAQISPTGRMAMLSKAEAAKLLDRGHGGLHQLFRNCSLAVLNCGSEMDDGKELLELYHDFDIRLIPRERGVKLDISNAPGNAFVDGKMIAGIQEHLFAVLRDVLYLSAEVTGNPRFDLETSDGLTDTVFHILRNAGTLLPTTDPRLIVCWGGHSISREEYEYTKYVGYKLGLRGLDICTGCGPGAMKGPMKGAAVGHAKQRTAGRFLGFTEPGIIAAEAPNPICTELVIFPDIEKRLEAFVRTGHGIIVFPGGVGTAEEILYILGILLHPDNAELPFPLVFTGPKSAEAYFRTIDTFIGDTLGRAAQQRYKIIIDDPDAVAREMKQGLMLVREYRKATHDAFNFNWMLTIDHAFQQPFEPTHANMRDLTLSHDVPAHQLAANLRRAFSGVVAGNVKADGIREIERHGPFELHGERAVVERMDALLAAFVAQQRMKLPGKAYNPCYKLVGKG